MSSSALHRYCTGEAVPPDFSVVERFGRVCGADRRELLNLHHLWLASVARRDRPRTARLFGRALSAGLSSRAGRLARQSTRRTLYVTGTAAATAAIAVLSRWTSRPRRRHA